jgi:hypothetical protein
MECLKSANFVKTWGMMMMEDFKSMKVWCAGDALHALKLALNDSSNVLQSWDPTLVNPCTWFHVTCNPESYVIRVYVFWSALMT